MWKRPEIAIVGGGPAGLTAAVILHRAGHRVRVYEQDPSAGHRAQGGTLDLHADSGQLALQRAGLLEAFREVARHEDQETRHVDSASGQIVPEEAMPGEDLDRPEIDRGLLRRLLLDALPPDVVQGGRRLKHVDFGTAGAHGLVFEEGVLCRPTLSSALMGPPRVSATG